MKKLFFAVLFLSYTTQAQITMTPDLLWKLGRVSLEDLSPDGRKALYGVTFFDIDENKGSKLIYEIPTSGGTASLLVDGEKNLSAAGYITSGQTWFIHAGQLFLKDGNRITQLTEIEGGIISGKVIGLSNGKLRILVVAEVPNPTYRLPQYKSLTKAKFRLYDDLMYRHWNYWEDTRVQHIFFADVPPAAERLQLSAFRDILEGEPYDAPLKPFGGSEQFVSTADGRYIFYTCKKLTGKDYAVSTNSDIYRYEVATDQTVNITSGQKGYDLNPVISPDGKLIAYLSMERDGYESDVPRLMLYDIATGTTRLAIENTYLHDVVWESNSTLLITYDDSATVQIGRVSIDLRRNRYALTPVTSGWYNYGSLRTAGGTLLATRMDMNHAPEVFRIDRRGQATQITQVNTGIYNAIRKPTVTRRMVPTTDGRQMLVWVILPPDFDPSKKYPVLLYCQGGPQSPVSQFYSFRWNFQVIASQGYIVVAPNRRGVPGFGREWNEAISGDWGGQPMRDYLSAIDHVAAEPWADESRMGAIGASYGGYSVYMLAGLHEGRFKALVSHCGLFDMKSWYGTTEELFFANWDLEGPYWADPMPRSYTEFSPSLYVDRWTAPLLVIHGELDFRVPVEQGLQAFQAAKLRGLPARLLLFPDEGHWVLKPQNALIWHSEFFRFLDTFLKN
ncbi:peptidase S9 [Thermaurantimonas aggregans]|uniref:Peptidase S9 n=1 Tax=Thermaurantimonas aggregans TaxID=2173829 RepID=A0A401XK15_9FLAO|nr:S9 family peptidase [Thermaurantimonas aggregans]MCX8148551.1 S9 family peptidase [Thermaurantimonas aggregans]GCD77375.1 peptidase S9 [Thermaurantimonas aggregans]